MNIPAAGTGCTEGCHVLMPTCIQQHLSGRVCATCCNYAQHAQFELSVQHVTLVCHTLTHLSAQMPLVHLHQLHAGTAKVSVSYCSRPHCFLL